MSDPRSSLSVTYYDPETLPVPEPEQEPATVIEQPKRRGRPPGAKNVPKSEPKRSVPWFAVWRAVFWATVAIVSVTSLYRGVDGSLGQSVANIVLAVSVLVAAFLLDRDWKKMRAER